MAAASISNYAKRMAHLSAKIFGELARPTDMKSMKVYRLFSEEPYNLKPGVVDYYPRHRELAFLANRLRFHGLYRDEHEDFKDEMKRLRKLRGKGPPKKGEGKRAMKRK